MGRNDDADVARLRQLAIAEALCSRHGERLNAPSRRVLRALYASAKPLKAYDLMHAVANGGRAAAPPTVYRALKILIAIGAAHRIEILNAFVACRFPGELHLAGFYVCEDCGSAEEFRLDDPPPQAVAMHRGRLVFEVLRPCPRCQASQARSV